MVAKRGVLKMTVILFFKTKKLSSSRRNSSSPFPRPRYQFGLPLHFPAILVWVWIRLCPRICQNVFLITAEDLTQGLVGARCKHESVHAECDGFAFSASFAAEMARAPWHVDMLSSLIVVIDRQCRRGFTFRAHSDHIQITFRATVRSHSDHANNTISYHSRDNK